MPGLNPREMNGHDYGRFGNDQGYTNGHFDPYSRSDRDDMGNEDPYKRPVRNGMPRPVHDRFNDHLADQSSLSDFNSSEPAFELDHLATFAAGGPRKGTMHVEDGLRKLRQMENTTGIWTMRCILLVERRFTVILDKNSGEELERFPVQFIHEPTAIFKNDRREIYNNLILFTVMDESNKRDAQADMHIFQSVRTPAQNIVDEIFAAKRGQSRVSSAGEADLFEIFRKNSIETQKEVESELRALSSLPPSEFVVLGTNDQFVWKWGAGGKQSEVESSSKQQLKGTAESYASQNTSGKQYSHNTSDSQQSNSRIVSSGAKKSEIVPESTGHSDHTQTEHSHSSHQFHSREDDKSLAFTASQQTAALSHIKNKALHAADSEAAVHDRYNDSTAQNRATGLMMESGLGEITDMYRRANRHNASSRVNDWSELQQKTPATASQNMTTTSNGQTDIYHRSDKYKAGTLLSGNIGSSTATEQADLYSSSNRHNASSRVNDWSELQQKMPATANQNMTTTSDGQTDIYHRSDRYKAGALLSGNIGSSTATEQADLYSSPNKHADNKQNAAIRRTMATANHNGVFTANEQEDLYSKANKRKTGISEHQRTAANRIGDSEEFMASGQTDLYSRVNKHAGDHSFMAMRASEEPGIYSRVDNSRTASWHQQKSAATANHNASNEHFAKMRPTEQAERTERNETSPSTHGYKIPPPPSGPAPEPPGSRDPYDFGGFRETIDHQYNVSQYNSSAGGFIGGGHRTSMMARPNYLPYREREDEIGSNELLERDVQLLNHCFDDIEKFVARLQQAAEAYKELERRKRERGGKGKKGPAAGPTILAHRARPPPAQDFIDIFQKFKLSFNLLAKLKAHIHDPNAPELVHFLFTPLSLIYEASRDPIHGSVNLGEQAAAPVLTQDAKQLLLNCLTSKEIELWQALGKNWTTSKEEWKGYIPPYVPRFYDGWEPAPTIIDEPSSRSNFDERRSHRAIEDDRPIYVPVKPMPFPDENPYQRERVHEKYHEREFDRDPTPTRNINTPYSVEPSNDGWRVPEPVPHREPPPPISHPAAPREIDNNLAYLEELKRTGSLAYEVLHDRQGKNAKELTVTKGDYLQVLDNSRNWWKVRNFKGESGYCPYTILKSVNGDSGRDASNASVDQVPTVAKKSSGSSRESYAAERTPPHAKENQGPVASRFEEILIPTLDMEEEEAERHAFQPVEPSAYTNRGQLDMRRTKPEVDLHNELRSKMGMAHLQRRGRGERELSGGQEMLYPVPDSYQHSSMMGVDSFYITRNSSQSDVSAWLHMKGFSTMCRHSLQGFTGQDLFSLHRNEMEQLIGHEEAARLEGQITLQKKMTGYKTQSAAELNAIFQKRRARADQQGAPLGQPPDFRPLTPSSYDGPDSDSDNDDRQLADTGKTLRDLLMRQRQKIVGSSLFDQQ